MSAGSASAVAVAARANPGGSIDAWLYHHREIASSLPGAGLPWLDALRSQALARFAQGGWPSGRLENWRHTSLLFMEQEAFKAVPAAASTRLTGLEDYVAQLRGDDEGHWLVFVDGRFAADLSQPGTPPIGAEIVPLSQALQARSPLAAAAFGDVAQVDSPAALNAAFAADGALIALQDGVQLGVPVHLVFIAASAGVAAHVRNLVSAGTGARATVMEHFVAFGKAAADGGAAAGLTTTATRIDAGVDARITHLKLQLESPSAIHLGAIDAVQARGSCFASHSLSFGSRLARHDIGTRFDGERCEALLNGVYHVDGKRHVDHHTRIEHARPRGVSREYYRGILDDAARGVFTGRIRVAPGALRTDAVQRTDSLLLSPRAEADARPELEIYADDVKCAHGATVGQLDEDGLFYLRSRGLDEGDARNILTYAFAAEALARIDSAPLRRRAAAAIRSRLPGGEAMEASW
jgi:Fe-S cluster assembly protein SufD